MESPLSTDEINNLSILIKRLRNSMDTIPDELVYDMRELASALVDEKTVLLDEESKMSAEKYRKIQEYLDYEN